MNTFLSIIRVLACLTAVYFLTATHFTNDIQEKQLYLLWSCVNMLSFLISFNKNYDE